MSLPRALLVLMFVTAAAFPPPAAAAQFDARVPVQVVNYR